MAECHDSNPISPEVLDSYADFRNTLIALIREGRIRDTDTLEDSLSELLTGLDEDRDRGVDYLLSRGRRF